METLTQRETRLVTGAGTSDQDWEIYERDLKQQMRHMTPAQIAAHPGFRGGNKYGGVSLSHGDIKINIGPGSYTHNTNPPKTVSSFGIEVTMPLN